MACISSSCSYSAWGFVGSEINSMSYTDIQCGFRKSIMYLTLVENRFSGPHGMVCAMSYYSIDAILADNQVL
jgi:hypothetical protein